MQIERWNAERAGMNVEKFGRLAAVLCTLHFGIRGPARVHVAMCDAWARVLEVNAQKPRPKSHACEKIPDSGLLEKPSRIPASWKDQDKLFLRNSFAVDRKPTRAQKPSLVPTRLAFRYSKSARFQKP